MDNKERFIRWQAILRDQLTFLNSLLLTTSIGILCFVFSLLKNPQFNIQGCHKVLFSSGLILIFLSALIGLFTALNRLCDFRITTQKIKSEGNGSGNLESLKELMKMYGKVTWTLFYSQIITKILGVISLFIALCLEYQDKLF
jgi:hypothetical protein